MSTTETGAAGARQRPAAGGRPGADPHPFPLPPRAARALVLAAVLTCAACGLVYELALVALGSYLLGDSVVQASVVLSLMIFAMGLGSLAAKRWQSRAPEAFAAVEGVLALVGGVSVLALYASFVWLEAYTVPMVGLTLVVGGLIGAEIPLLMVMLQHIREEEAGSAVADMFAADYVGALVGGLAFPFLLLPAFGQIRGTLLTGCVNAVAGMAVVLWLFRRRVPSGRRRALWVGLGAVLTVLVTVAASVGRFEEAARARLFAAPVVHAERTPHQEIVVTRAGDELALHLDGRLRFASTDEFRHHEALVHPAMAGPRERVLLLGGGDGLALREVVRYPDVREVVGVELDPTVVRLARTLPDLVALNAGSLGDPRARMVVADAFTWLRGAVRTGAAGRFDVVVVDLPEPRDTASAKLYSVELYGLVRRVLAPDGRVAVRAGAAGTDGIWYVSAGLEAAGLHTLPYRVNVPSLGGPSGYVLAAATPPRPLLAPDAPPLRWLTPGRLGQAVVPPEQRRRRPPSTLDRPRVLDS